MRTGWRLFIRVISCDFVDRVLSPKKAIHEITPNNTTFVMDTSMKFKLVTLEDA